MSQSQWAGSLRMLFVVNQALFADESRVVL